MARVTGGIERTTWDDVFNTAHLRSRQLRDLVIPLTLMLLVLHVAEIGGRRLLLFAAARGWLGTVRFPRLPGGWTRAGSRPVVVSQDPDGEGAPSGETTRVAPPSPATSPLARAKAKARDRMGL